MKEQVKAWLLERIDEAPWYRRWPAKGALWLLERELQPQALGCFGWFVIIWIIVIIVLIIVFR